MIVDTDFQQQREKCWAGVHAEYARLRSDPVAWQRYLDEIAVFEGGSRDGLQSEEPYYSAEEEQMIRAQHDSSCPILETSG